jgi:hypothetical protein
MNTKETKRWLFLLLGFTFFVQASTSLIGGLLFGKLESKTSIETTLTNISMHMQTFNVSVLLQFVTAIIIIMLGIAIYETAGHINKTVAKIGLLLYTFEAMLLAVGQIFLIGLMRVSELYLATGDAGLVNLGEVLLESRHFAGEIAMLPFGIGAICFYYLLMKAKIIPKWLALWGLVTAPFIMVYFTLGTMGIMLPFAICIPYVPFEFFTGAFIMIKYRKLNSSKQEWDLAS